MVRLNQSVHSIHILCSYIEGGGYSRSFEQDVLGILQGLNQEMARMKSNPAVTKNEVDIYYFAIAIEILIIFLLVTWPLLVYTPLLYSKERKVLS